MAAEQVYKKIPENMKPYNGKDRDLKTIFDQMQRAIKLLKMEVKRLQEEKQDA